MNISIITRADLLTLEPLLLASYGDGEYSIADEFDYFPNPAPADWCWASERGHVMGFLRHFAADAEIGIAELHAPNLVIARALLEHFAAHHDFSERQKLRFDLSRAMRNLETVIRDVCEIIEVVNVHHYEKRIAPIPEMYFEHQAVSDFQRVAQILGALKPYSADQLEQLHSQHELFVIHQNQTPVAAAHVQRKTVDTLEIVTLATDINHHHQGHAQALLRDVEQYAAQHSLSIVFQVRNDNKSAIGLYERAGYCANAECSVRWLYTRWSKSNT